MADAAPNLTGFGLPVEYQGQLEALSRRRQMAQALLQSSLAPRPLQMAGRVAVRQSPFTPLISALTGQAAQGADEAATGGMRQLLGQADQEARDELSSLAAQPVQARIAKALASRFPGVRSMGQEWDKRNLELVKEVAKLQGEYGAPEEAIAGLTSQQLPAAGWRRPPLVQPEERQLSDKTPFILTRDNKGQPHVQIRPAGTSITLPSTDRIEQIKRLDEERKPYMERAQVAKEGLANIRYAAEALQQGAVAGGGAPLVHGLQKVAQFFGWQLPATTDTTVLEMALGKQVLANARKLAPVTANDISFLEKTEGSISTDPTALSRMLGRLAAVNILHLQNHEKWMNQVIPSIQDPTTQARFQAGMTGLEVPKQLFGDPRWALGVVDELRNLGGDPGAFSFRHGKEEVTGDQTYFPGLPRLGPPRRLKGPEPLPPGVR